MLRRVLLLSLLFLPLFALATHNRAGEIIVCKVDPSDPTSLLYEAMIITHTKTSAPADRPELDLDWGDGVIETIPRESITSLAPLDAQRNVYRATHLYTGPGTYTLQFIDENRNGGVLNIPNSVAQAFCVKTNLVISPVAGHNCSVRFLKAPLQDACLQQPWIHNPVAYDPDGDSLSFEPVVCRGMNCDPILGYEYPDGIAPGLNNQYDIDPVTGTITWVSPQAQGEYNLAFLVREWRRVNGVLYQMGWVTRDMQVTVGPCSNQPPVITDVADTCVLAGTFLSFQVQANDPNPLDDVTLNALGQPFLLSPDPASFTSPNPGNPVTGVFNWNTNCSHVRLQPYQVVFNAIDDATPVMLQDFSTVNITVVAPAPENPVAAPNGTRIDLSWDQSICTNATGYKIYRRAGLYGFVPDNCETGVPAYTGYVQVGTTTGLTATTFSDDQGLVFGNQYCYMVVACFADGAESYASEEFCAILDRQVPVVTNVSVGVTDLANGIDTVRWSNAFDLDTIARPGPYQFRLYRGGGFTTANTEIHVSGLHPFIDHPDTAFLDVGLDTRTGPHVYRVELYGDNGNDLIGSSNVASSVFLVLDPNDEQVTLTMQSNTPWINSAYEIFRFDGLQFVLIGTTNTNTYVDTGLVNGEEYCYYAKSIGAYSDPDIVSPLINFSQEACAIPVDLTPPCPPTVVIDNDCEIPLNTLTWNNPNNSCADDTWRYNIWFTDSLGGEFILIATLTSAEDTVFEHVNGNSVAGCYAISAIDTVGNESAFSNIVCGDNCPEYELPNVFTPNQDGTNDTFRPFPYRGVNRIDLLVFNRWGQVVFSSEDPDIGWNGVHQDSGEPVPDGVYYYVCKVFVERLSGQEILELTGYVHILGSSNTKLN